MNVKEIVLKHLKENGYDGLFNPDVECGCMNENLSPADCMKDICCPGYLSRPTGGERYDGHEWIICGFPVGREANARLIAAAPDLLAACESAHKAFIEQFSHHTFMGTTMKAFMDMEEAIRKARGEE